MKERNCYRQTYKLQQEKTAVSQGEDIKFKKVNLKSQKGKLSRASNSRKNSNLYLN